jgi:histone acetyltransferase (RNA polymerase elongator complex component)
MEVDEIISKIELNLSTMDSQSSEIEVAFFGGSFTCLELEEQNKYLELVQPYISCGQIKSIRLSTRPDYISQDILDFLKTKHVETIELGVQSMDDAVLKSSGRGHTTQDVINASELIRANGFKLGLQMMVGLPGDSAEKSLETAKRITSLNPDCVRIYPALVVRNTELEDLYNKGMYQALALDEAIEWVAPVMKQFIQNQINVIRVGLHPSEGFESGGNLVAGPYHVSFRELVMTRLWYEEFKGITVEDNSDLTVFIANDEYNNAIGYKAYNKNYLKQKFRRVKFLRSTKLKDMEYYVDYN